MKFCLMQTERKPKERRLFLALFGFDPALNYFLQRVERTCTPAILPKFNSHRQLLTPQAIREAQAVPWIKSPWDKENLPAYLVELLTELNERTPYELTLQPWKCYSEWKNRIRVSQKKSDEAVLIQQIQLLVLRKGKTVQAERIWDWISQILN
jgi:hypothetical protein